MRLGKQRYESKYLAIEYFYTNNGWSISLMCKKLGIARSEALSSAVPQAYAIAKNKRIEKYKAKWCA